MTRRATPPKPSQVLPRGVSWHRASERYQGRAVVSLRDGSRERIVVYGSTPNEALDLLAKMKREREVLVSERRTVSGFLEEWLLHIRPGGANPQRVRPATYGNRLQALAPLLPASLASGKLASHSGFEVYRAKPVRELDDRDLQSILDRMVACGVGSRTVQIAYESLRAAWRYGVSRHHVDPQRSPFVIVARPRHEAKEKTSLSDAEVGRLFDAIRAVRVPRSRALLLLLATTGLRISEALALRWSDVIFEDGAIRVHYQLGEAGERAPLKTSESRRELWPVAEVMEALEGLRPSAIGDFVFETAKGRPLDRNNARTKILHPVLEKAGLVDRVTLHGLRSVAASLLAPDVEPVVLLKLFGWKSMSVAAKFYVRDSDRLREAGRSAMEKAVARIGSSK